jgi:hypothetical protein
VLSTKLASLVVAVAGLAIGGIASAATAGDMKIAH